MQTTRSREKLCYALLAVHREIVISKNVTPISFHVFFLQQFQYGTLTQAVGVCLITMKRREKIDDFGLAFRALTFAFVVIYDCTFHLAFA